MGRLSAQETANKKEGQEKKIGSQGVFPPSIDRNREMAEGRSMSDAGGSSPSQSASSSTRELEQVINLGSQVGFQFDREKVVILGAVSGAGVNNGHP